MVLGMRFIFRGSNGNILINVNANDCYLYLYVCDSLIKIDLPIFNVNFMYGRVNVKHLKMSGVVAVMMSLGAANVYAETCRHESLDASDSVIRGQFNSQGKDCFTLPLQAGFYFNVVLKGGSALVLADEQRKHIRTLFADMPITSENKGVFDIHQDKKYTFVIRGNPSDQYQIQLIPHTAVPLKVELQNEIISPTITRLKTSIDSGGKSTEFWRERTLSGAPMVEPYDEQNRIVTFLWRGARQNAYILGAPSGDHDPLFHLPGSDVWFRSYIVPADTLMSYKIAPDVPEITSSAREQRRAILITAQADPLNPQASPYPSEDKYNHHSLLNLAGDKVCRARLSDGQKLHGVVNSFTFYSPTLKNNREIAIYEPTLSHGDNQARNVVFLFDGKTYMKKYHIHKVLDKLIADKEIPPVTLVFVDVIDAETREKELPPNPDFADFMAKELIPWLAQKGINTTADKTIVSGSSYGGLASAWVAYQYPAIFGNVLSMSGSYWWAPKDEEGEWLIRQFAASDKKAIRFYLEAGRFENRGDNGGILMNNRHFYDLLKSKGYDVEHAERSSGHDYISWCEAIPHGIKALLR